ncbi:ATP-grasp fold amidoligase family protein [Agathobaculum sp. NTUH-O15-33]|uniref:ATP-grasp fold amidoligase family protein n=1 Tax=Agathobaculum sp. NTUH-O15-33 TaxID=3079302 RepID=UPI002958D494|nr:ATP-grasp fold amidoligase family protein [Agathobaculum sp. NTUH-O15-33]WNX83430.1 ATP-grasp fold amidoligase family protein [Agathobaculum sp. NTUH-O15-33]
MKKPIVSVVIPVYNAQHYLEQCLESVMHQTLKEIEIICVDDGSIDNSLKILYSYQQKDSRIKIYTQKNQFAGVARNNGFALSKGKYVLFMDSDDFCEKSLLEQTVKIAEEYLADIVVFDHYRYDEQSTSLELKKDINKSVLPQQFKTFSYKDCPQRIMSIINPVPWNKLIRSNFLKNNHLSFETLSSTNDITFSSMCAVSASKIAYIEKPLIYYRVNFEGSITSSKCNKLSNVIRALLLTYEHAHKLDYYKKVEQSVQYFIISNLYFSLNNYAGARYSKGYEDFYNECGKLFFGHPVFYTLKKEMIRDNKLWKFFSEAQESSKSRFDRSYFPKVVVSLTSYPKRIGTVHQTIQTLMQQTILPDKIVLWLAQSQFPNLMNDLPLELTNLISEIIEVKWTKDLKAYKKLIPSLKEYPEDIIITVDDDLLFDKHLIEFLLRGFRSKPNCIQCHRITSIYYNNANDIQITPDAIKVYPVPTYLHKLSGGAGCLYPPHCLHSDVLREDLFCKLTPTNDDIWFWIMGMLNGYKINVVDKNISRLSYIAGTQEEALWKINDRGEKLFYIQLNNILNYYPILKDLLFYEQMAMESLQLEGDRQQSIQIHNMEKFQMLKSQITNLQKRVETLSDEVHSIRHSITYKVGRCITWMPRKIRGIIHCYKDHGASYTFRRILIHLRILSDMEQSKAIVLSPTSINKQNPSSPNRKNASSKVIRNYDYFVNLQPEQYEEELKLWYKRVTKEDLNLENPRTFNEKIQWLKLYDSSTLKTQLADKFLVRQWVSERIGKAHLIPLLGVWEKFDEINFNELPEQFVLKMNHGSGWNAVVKDKNAIDYSLLRQKFDEWGQKNFAFVYGLELHYMNIPPRIIAEKYMADLEGDIYDYRFFCFNGQPRFVWVDIGSGTNHHKRNIYNLNWVLQDYGVNYPHINPEPVRPKTFNEMVGFAKILCKEFAFVRVDFYSVNDQVYFGEMTFTPQSGTGKWDSEEQNKYYGDLIKLPPKSPLPKKKGLGDIQ